MKVNEFIKNQNTVKSDCTNYYMKFWNGTDDYENINRAGYMWTDCTIVSWYCTADENGIKFFMEVE